MYPPAWFKDETAGAALEIARLTRFATVIAAGADGPITVYVPITVVPDTDPPRIVGHIVRTSPLFALLSGGEAEARLSFVAAHGYVSPRVYAEKPVSGRVVPTWNYVAAQLDGRMRLEEADGALLEILDLQSADYETATGGDWRLADAPADFIERLSQALAGFSFTVTDALAIKKLSQNRPDEIPAVIDWLDATAPAHGTPTFWMRAFGARSAS